MPDTFYAHINDENLCTGVTQYQTHVNPTDNMIELGSFDATIVGMVWDAAGNQWIVNPDAPDDEDPEPIE